jgi:hypothetical protein
MFQKNQILTEGTGFSGSCLLDTNFVEIGTADWTTQQQFSRTERTSAKSTRMNHIPLIRRNFVLKAVNLLFSGKLQPT